MYSSSIYIYIYIESKQKNRTNFKHHFTCQLWNYTFKNKNVEYVVMNLSFLDRLFFGYFVKHSSLL